MLYTRLACLPNPERKDDICDILLIKHLLEKTIKWDEYKKSAKKFLFNMLVIHAV